MKAQIIPARVIVVSIGALVDDLTQEDLVTALDSYQRALLETYREHLFAMGGDAKRRCLFVVMADQASAIDYMEHAEDDVNRLLAFFSSPRREVRPVSAKFPDLIAQLEKMGYQVEEEDDEPEEV